MTSNAHDAIQCSGGGSATGNGEASDQLDLVEVRELDGPRMRRHRISWDWQGPEHVIASTVVKATTNSRAD